MLSTTETLHKGNAAVASAAMLDSTERRSREREGMEYGTRGEKCLRIFRQHSMLTYHGNGMSGSHYQAR